MVSVMTSIRTLATAAPLFAALGLFAGTADAQEADGAPVEPLAVPTLGAEVDPPDPAAGYDKGFFIYSADGAFAVKFQGRVQGRFEFESADEGGSRAEEAAFLISRARLTMKGHAFSKDIKYKFQADFGKGNVVLKDFIVDKKLGGKAWVRVGQYKRPFSRQHINSSGRLELVDRAITDKAFGNGRDIGIMVHDNYEKSPEFEWAVGVFNGTGDKASLSGDVVVDPMTGEGEITGGKYSNVPGLFQPTLVARVGYNSGGIKGYSEVDFAGGPLRFGVAASVLAQLDSPDDDNALSRAGVDFIVKNDGLSASGAFYVATAQDGSAPSDQSYAAMGFHAQAGYLLQKKYQPAVRFAMVNPDGDDNNTMEVTGGVSVYSHDHGFKWQTDAGARIGQTPGDSTNDILVRTQLQLSF
jgi:hypothetical protein